MSVTSVQLGRNLLLAALGSADQKAIRELSQIVDMQTPDRICPADKTIRYVYFPLSGMISLVQAFKDGSTTEVGLIGREGFWGAATLLGVKSSPIEAMVQGVGQALRMPTTAFLPLVEKSPDMRTRLLRYAHFLHVQVTIIAACNAQHRVRQRLARWLLEGKDRLEGEALTLKPRVSIVHARRAPRRRNRRAEGIARRGCDQHKPWQGHDLR